MEVKLFSKSNKTASRVFLDNNIKHYDVEHEKSVEGKRSKAVNCICLKHHVRTNSLADIISINQYNFDSGLSSVNGGGRIYPTLTAISPTPTPTLHLA